MWLVSDKITLSPLESFRSRLSPTVFHLPPYRIVMSENKVCCVSSLNRGADRSSLSSPPPPRSCPQLHLLNVIGRTAGAEGERQGGVGIWLPTALYEVPQRMLVLPCEAQIAQGISSHPHRGPLPGKWPSAGVERWSIWWRGRGGFVSRCPRSPKTKWVLWFDNVA